MEKHKYYVLVNNIVVNIIIATEEYVNSVNNGMTYIRHDLAGPEIKWEPPSENQN